MMECNNIININIFFIRKLNSDNMNDDGMRKYDELEDDEKKYLTFSDK